MITTTYLEISDPSVLRPPRAADSDTKEVHLKRPPTPAACSAMYSAVGKAYYWDLYRIGWTDIDWSRYFHHPDIEISFICNKDGDTVGYLELRAHPDNSAEIVIFGLRPEFTGQRFGRPALELAVRRGFELGSAGVWLHTCSLDHSSALKVYYACGFRLLREEITDYLPLDTPPASEPTLARLVNAAGTTSAAG